MCSKIHGDKISGVIRKTNCGRRFTLLDLLVAEILQRGQPDEIFLKNADTSGVSPFDDAKMMQD